MKAFIGQYFTTLKGAEKAYAKLSKEMKKHKSIVQLEGNWFIVGNSTIDAFNKKGGR